MGPPIDRMARRSSLLVLLCLASLVTGITQCPKQKLSPGREVICYTYKNDAKLLEDSICRCTTLVHQGHDIQNLTVSDFQEFSKELKEANPPLQFVISVDDPSGILKTSGTSRQAAAVRLAGILNEVDGVELNVTAGSKERLYHFVKGLKDEMIRKSIDKRILMVLPTKPEELAKQFDLKELTKYVDLFTIATHYLVDDDEVYHTFHPSRMMGLFDMLNTDSLVDLISGLGAPKRKLLISMPASAYRFRLKNETENAPRSRTEDKYPTVIDRNKFCESMDDDGWTIERDEDLTAPYAFKNKTWIAFEDKISAGIKGKYVMLRDLAGLGIWEIENDLKSNCGKPITHEVHHSFMDFKRKSRHAVLTSLEDDLHQALITYPNKAKSSGYRVVRVVDTEGHIRAVRENTQTEFTCTRQGYFVHPKSCNRFYRCVKFNQGIENYSVFEFDCPAGLAFDERTEVCVWPGSLPEGSPCPGSSEVAPAPQVRFQCPPEPGYYVDPRNCRWFFACMDLGGPELMAFEFRCPYDLVFDQEKLVCEWPWLVPSCSNTGSGYTRSDYDFHGGVGSTQGAGKFVTGGIPVGFSGTTGAGYYGATGGAGGYSTSAGTKFTGSSAGQFDQHSGNGQLSSHGGYSGSTGSGYSGGVGKGGIQIGYTETTGSGYSGGTGKGGIQIGYTGSTGSGYSGGAGKGGIQIGYTESTGSGYSGGVGQVGSKTGYSGSTGSGYSGGAGKGGIQIGYTETTGSGYSGGAGKGGIQIGYTDSTGPGYSGGVGQAGSKISYSGSTGSGYSGAAGKGGIQIGYTESKGSGYSGGAGKGGIQIGYTETTGSGYTGGAGKGGIQIGYTESTGSGYSGGVGQAGSKISYSGSTGSGYSGGAGKGGIQIGYTETTGSGYTGGAGKGGIQIDYSGSTGSGYSGGQDSSIGGQYTGGYKTSIDTGYYGGRTTSDGSAYSGSAGNVYQGSTTGVHAGLGYSGIGGGSSESTTYSKAGGHVSVGSGYSQSSDGTYQGSTGTIQASGGSAGSIGGGYSIATNAVEGSQYSGSSVTGSGYSESGNIDYSGGSIRTDSGLGHTGSIGLGTQDFTKGSGGYSDNKYYQGTTKGTFEQVGGQGKYSGSSGSSDSGYSQGSSITGSLSGIGHAETTDYSGSTRPGYSGSGFSTKTTYTGSFDAAGHLGSSSSVHTGTSLVGSKHPGGSTIAGQGISGVSQGSGFGTYTQGQGGSSTKYIGGSQSSGNELPGYTIPVAIVPDESPYGQHGGISGTFGLGEAHTVGVSQGSGSTSSVYTNYQGQAGGFVTDHTASTGQSGIKTTYAGGIGTTSTFGKGRYSGHAGASGSDLNITLVLGGTPTPSTVYQQPGYHGVGYNVGQGSTGTIVTGSSVEGAIITDDSSSGTLITQGDLSGSVSTGAEHQGSVITGSSQPGYVHTQTGTPGYVVSEGVKTVYTGSSSPGTFVQGSISPGVTLSGTSTPGVILHGQSSPAVHLTGQTSSGVFIGGAVHEGTTVGGSAGNHYYTESGSSIYAGGRGSANAGASSTTESTSYKTNEYHDNGGRGTIKFNNGLVTTKYTESDLTDYRTSIGTLPDKVIPGGRLDTVRGQAGSSSTFGQDSFTKTGPTKTGYVTATLGGRGSYVISNGQRRPTTNYEKIGESAFEGNVAGYTKTSKVSSNVITSTEASDGTHIDTSKLTFGPGASGTFGGTTSIQSSTSAPAIGKVPFGTTPTYNNVGVYQSSTGYESGSVTSTSGDINTYAYSRPSYGSGKVPSGFTTGQLENYKTTAFGAAGIPVSVSTIHPVIDNGYQTIISSTPIPVTLTGDTYSYKDNRFHGGSLSTQAQSALDASVSFQQTGSYDKTDHITVTTSSPSASISSGYIPAKSRPSVTYQQSSGTSKPEGQYLPSSTSIPVSGGFKGYTYTKGKIPFDESSTPSAVTYQQSTGSIRQQYVPSTTPSSTIGVTYTRPFSIPGVTYDKSTPGSIISIGDTSSGHGYSTKTTFGSSVNFGGSPTNVDIPRDKVETLVNNYNRGTVKYTSSAYDTYTGTDKSSSGQTYLGSTRIQNTPSVTTYNGGYTRVSSVTPSYEVSTKTTSKGKVIVKWSDLHPLLLGKLGAECTCKADPFANLRGPGKKLIDSSKGQIDLANYDESEVYVDLEKDDSNDYDYVTNYETSSPRPFKIISYENKALIGASDKASSIKTSSRPSSTYLPAGSTSVTQSYASSARSGKKLEQGGSSSNSLAGATSFNSYLTGNSNFADEILEGPNDCARPGLFRHPNFCNKFYACHWDEWKKTFTLHVFNCPVHLTFDSNASACNWPSKGPACQDDNLLV